MAKKEYILIAAIIVLIAGYFVSAMLNTDNPEINQNNKGKTDSLKKGDPSHVVIYPTPDSVTFAGETIALDDPDLIERYDKEIIVNTHFHSSTIILIKKTNQWLPLFVPILKKYGVPEDFKYLTLVEGGLSNDRSPRGAVGFWQLLPSTARELGLIVNSEVDERYNPIKSTEAACKYLLRAKEKFGTWTNAAASYNMGMRGLARRMEQQEVDNYYDLLLNDETSRYIFRIIALKKIVENPAKYGFDIPEDQLYEMEPLDTLKITESIDDLTEFAFSKGVNYKILKFYNPWLRRNTLTVNRRYSEFKITIPREHHLSVHREVNITDTLMLGEDRLSEDPEPGDDPN